ncbi:MAG: hypothetical protein U1D97_02765 [Desulfuromonadales bacterium]|nr:hypothetical protein [Desulfuromonadales bacterium]
MSNNNYLPTVRPEAFNLLRSFKANIDIDVSKTGSVDFQEKVSCALIKSLKIACQIDRETFRDALVAEGVPEEVIASIYGKLKLTEIIKVRDLGLPWHMRKNPGVCL